MLVVLFDDSKDRLAGMRAAIEDLLDGVRLAFTAMRTECHFFGWRVFPERARFVRPNVVGFRRRLRKMEREYSAGSMDVNDVRMRIHSWIGHAASGDIWRLRRQMFGQFKLAKRSAVISGLWRRHLCLPRNALSTHAPLDSSRRASAGPNTKTENFPAEPALFKYELLTPPPSSRLPRG